jgi:hypothetical protein
MMRTGIAIVWSIADELRATFFAYQLNGEFTMTMVHSGQCGLCSHFGEDHMADPKLIELRTKHQAPDNLVDDCGHPKHAALHLKVTPISGCDGFVPVKMDA